MLAHTLKLKLMILLSLPFQPPLPFLLGLELVVVVATIGSAMCGVEEEVSSVSAEQRHAIASTKGTISHPRARSSGFSRRMQG